MSVLVASANLLCFFLSFPLAIKLELKLPVPLPVSNRQKKVWEELTSPRCVLKLPHIYLIISLLFLSSCNPMQSSSEIVQVLHCVQWIHICINLQVGSLKCLNQEPKSQNWFHKWSCSVKWFDASVCWPGSLKTAVRKCYIQDISVHTCDSELLRIIQDSVTFWDDRLLFSSLKVRIEDLGSQFFSAWIHNCVTLNEWP